jgi:hypothetical protein
MDKNKIRKEIADLINSIKEHSDNIGDNKHIAQLELELILSKIKSLYEKSIVFNYLNSHPETEQKNTTPTTTIEEKIMVEISKKEEKAVAETIEILQNNPVADTKIIEEEKNPEPVVIQKSTSTRLADIKAAIGINDKFQFANELFQGNMQEYEIGIQQLNSSENIDSAMVYFNSLQKLYNWDLENETVKRLLSIVEKRYS